MTRLEKDVSRETTSTMRRYRGKMRPVIATLGKGDTIKLRLKGTRVEYEASIDGMMTIMASLAAQRIRDERKARRKKRA